MTLKSHIIKTKPTLKAVQAPNTLADSNHIISNIKALMEMFMNIKTNLPVPILPVARATSNIALFAYVG